MQVIDRLLRSYLKNRGYAVSKSRSTGDSEDFFLHQYVGTSGFDYAKYKAVQTEGNKRKINLVWTDRETIAFISDFLRSRSKALVRGLCHGSRNGSEVRWFQECLGIDVMGTDISDTATQFPNMVQWDFHEERPEWRGTFDFVYTNSHDHAYDPKKAMDAWVGQLAPGGVLLLEHSMDHSEGGASELDPFGVNPAKLPYVVLLFGEGRYCVTRILQPKSRSRNIEQTWIFVIERLADMR